MYIFIYRKNDVKKMYNFVISFIFRYWGKAPLPKKDMILWEYKKTQRGRLIYWFTPNSKSVMSANLISRRVIGKTMFLCIIDRISQSSLKNCIIKKEREKETKNSKKEKKYGTFFFDKVISNDNLNNEKLYLLYCELSMVFRTIVRNLYSINTVLFIHVYK